MKLYSTKDLKFEDIKSLSPILNLREERKGQIIEFLKRPAVGTQIKISPTKTLKFEERNGKVVVLEWNK